MTGSLIFRLMLIMNMTKTNLVFNTMSKIIITARKRSCGKVMFLQVPVILSIGGHAWLPGGHVWLGGMRGCQGDMHGCWGHVWLLGGVCALLPGGVCGCWGHVWLLGHAWLLGGMHGCGRHVWLPGACVVARGHA